MDTDELRRRIGFVMTANQDEVLQAFLFFRSISVATEMEAVILLNDFGKECGVFYLSVFPFFSTRARIDRWALFLQTSLFNAFKASFSSLNMPHLPETDNPITRRITFNEHDTALLKLMSLGINQWQR